MHMARLADPSRMKYALKSLTQELEPQIMAAKEGILNWMIDQENSAEVPNKAKLETLDHYRHNFLRIQKIDINSTFGFYKKLANGDTGKILMMPDLELMHISKQFIPDWVEYSCFDAEITYFLRETLSYQLSRIKTKEEQMGDMLNLYVKYWRPFGELLTDMEHQGIKIDRKYLEKCELEAIKEQEEHKNKFLQWVYSTQEDASDFNASSI